jgi:hypothetical protein
MNARAALLSGFDYLGNSLAVTALAAESDSDQE